MQFPTINPRRPLDDEYPDGYAESDRGYVENNLDAAVWLLDNCAELSSQLHFWREACDDAHNLGAARLGIATDTLEDVLEWIETGKVCGVGFDEQIVVEDIRASLKVLA